MKRSALILRHPALPRLIGPIIIGMVLATGIQWQCPATGGGTLQPDDIPADQNDSAAVVAGNPDGLAIVQGTPNGSVSVNDLTKEVVVVFNEPMIPLARLDAETKGIFNIDPPVPGTYRWYGSRVCAFQPGERFLPGTRYTVKVDGGVTSLAGQKLGESYEFQFETPPLALTGVYPRTGNTLEYDVDFRLYFNYPVSTGAVQRHVQLTANGENVPVTVQYLNDRPAQFEDGLRRDDTQEAELKRRIILKTLRSLPRDAEVELVIRAGLPPMQGNRGLEKDLRYTYRTYGPLKASLEAEAPFFQHMWRHRILFNNPVDLKKAAESLKFTPEAKLLYAPEGNGQYLYLGHFDVKPTATYQLELDAGLQDIYGNALVGERKFQVTIPRVRKDFHSDSGVYTIESRMQQRLPVQVEGLTDMNATVRTIRLSDLQSLASMEDQELWKLDGNNETERAWNTGLNPEQIRKVPFDLAPFLNQKQGIRLVRMHQQVEQYDGDIENKSRVQLVQSTN
ncbi:MAG: Ig-like domain-containing protein, partial [Leptospiraceae bacterium]|nr:Ig-like domain-containing protein [Leptospiraceae bacterium]